MGCSACGGACPWPPAPRNAWFPDCPAASDISLWCPSRALQNAGRCGVAHAEQAAGAMSDREIAVRHLHLGMGFTTKLPHCFDDLGHATAIDRMVAAQSPTIGVERQFADTGNQIAVGDEFAALALLAKPEILELHQHRDGEAVVDRCVFDVLGRHARFFERAGAGPDTG